MRKNILYTFISFLLPPHTPIQSNTSLPPGSYTIEHITIIDKEGNPPPQAITKFILETLNIPPGTALHIPNDHFNNTIKKLWNHGYVIEINAKKIQENSLALQLIIHTIYPKIHTIEYKGLSLKEQKKITQKLNLTKGRPWLPHIKESLEARIEKHYTAQGYPYVQATITTEPSTDHHIHLHIHVRKNRQYHIGHIHFHLAQGTDHRDTYTLAQHTPYSKQGTLPHYNAWYKRLIQDIRRGYLTNILPTITRLIRFKNPLFIETKVQEDAKSLENYYRDKGFLDAKVHYELHSQGNQINITFHSHLGNRYTIANIEWTGNLLLSSEAINKGLNIQAGQPYEQNKVLQCTTLSDQQTTIHTLYQRTPYPVWVSATLQVKGIKDHQIYLQGYIQELPRPTITQINLHTTKKINPNIITILLNEHNITKGKKLTQDNIIAATQTLINTGFFHPNTLSIEPYPTAPNQVKIDFYAIETKNIDFTLGLEDRKFRLSIRENNFDLNKLLHLQKPFGGGQSLSANISFDSFSSFYLGATFTHPWLMIHKKRTPISFQAFRKYEKDQPTSFQYTIHCSRPHTKPYPHTYAQQLSLIRHTLAPPYNPISYIDTWTWQCFHYQQDRTNHPIYPTYGSQLKIEGNITGLLTNYTPWNTLYPQILAQYKIFHTPKTLPITFHSSLTIGTSPHAKIDNPLSKFMLGDSPFELPESQLIHPTLLSFRGYTDIPHPHTDNPYNGFQHLLTSSLEIRYTLLQHPLTYGLLFLDSAITNRNYLATIGAEIRILTPICILSGYIVYPSPQGGIGYRLRLMPLNSSV